MRLVASSIPPVNSVLFFFCSFVLFLFCSFMLDPPGLFHTQLLTGSRRLAACHRASRRLAACRRVAACRRASRRLAACRRASRRLAACRRASPHVAVPVSTGERRRAPASALVRSVRARALGPRSCARSELVRSVRARALGPECLELSPTSRTNKLTPHTLPVLQCAVVRYVTHTHRHTPTHTDTHRHTPTHTDAADAR